MRNQVGHVSAVRYSQLLGNLLHRLFFFFSPSESEYSCTRKSGFPKEKGNINLEGFFFFFFKRGKSEASKKHSHVAQYDLALNCILFCI